MPGIAREASTQAQSGTARTHLELIGQPVGLLGLQVHVFHLAQRTPVDRASNSPRLSYLSYRLFFAMPSFRKRRGSQLSESGLLSDPGPGRCSRIMARMNGSAPGPAGPASLSGTAARASEVRRSNSSGITTVTSAHRHPAW
jgi:hypothetical protein